MYEVKIINDEKEIIIHSPVISSEVPRLENGTIKKSINSIDSFSFSFTPNNPAQNKLIPLKTKIEVKNSKNGKIEFRGRILLPTPQMDSNGLFNTQVIAESELGYLNDSITRYAEFHDISVKDFLIMIIRNHNENTTPDKHFTVGIVEFTDRLYRFLGYENTFATIKDKLLDRLGGELQVRVENGVRYLDYLKEIGEHSSVEIALSKNLRSIEREEDPSNIISRLVPLGAKLEDTDERITVASVNNGLDYIDDLEAIKEFGIIEGTITWDDVNFPDILLKKAKEKQKEINKIRSKYNVEALDLSLIGLDFDSFELGNTYRLINPLMSVNDTVRIVEKTIDIITPQSSNLTIGEKFEDIKTYNLKSIENNKSLESVKGVVNSTVKVVKQVSEELETTVENAQNTNRILVETNTNLLGITKNVNSLLEQTLTLEKQLKEQSGQLTELKSKTNRLNKRVNMGM